MLLMKQEMNHTEWLLDIEDDPIYHKANCSDIVKSLQDKLEQHKQGMIPYQNGYPDPNAQAVVMETCYWYSWQDDEL